jgi:hypothetical protein
MRARRFLPMLDGLDRRLLLDGSTPTPVIPVTAFVYTCPIDTSMPGDEIDPVEVTNWNGSGNPPPDSDDPTDPTDEDATMGS